MKTLTDFTNQEIIDSRDLIEAMDELQNYIENELYDDEEDLQEAKESLKELEDFCEPFAGYSDWEYGETLIAQSYWVEYVKQLLEDCGDLPSNIPSYIEIDWETTADNIKVDYMEENGYLCRA